MERSDIVGRFSKRLNSLVLKEGYASARSKAGIEISELAKVAGVSYQMARKYALGLALPDYHVIPKIAKWLNVSPGWLLFGDKESIQVNHEPATRIEIEIDLLKYILQKCVVLFPATKESDKIINYITGVIYDASHVNADAKTILKMIDMMLSSALEFRETGKEKRA
jgi:transcriptional regulator with XRE-family HTH domain